MNGDEAKESAEDDVSSGDAGIMVPDASYACESTPLTEKPQKRKSASAELDMVDQESAAAEWQQEIAELSECYREVSGLHLNPDDFGCATISSIIACLLEESSLPYAKLTDEIYNRMKLKYGVTESSVRTSVIRIGKRVSYGSSAVDADELEDESECSLWCWEAQDLDLLPSHLHSSLTSRRKARKLIHERIMVLSGNLASISIGTPKAHGIKKNRPVTVRRVLNLDAIRTFVDNLKQKNDADITKAESKMMVQVQDISIAVKGREKTERQVQKEEKKKEKELKCIQENTAKQAKRIERENKRLKKQQEEVEREKKRQEMQQAELKRRESIQKQANIMERFLRRKTSSDMEKSDYHNPLKTSCSKSSGNIEELAIAVTSAMDSILSQSNCLMLEELWEVHVAGWRKLSQHNRLCHWGVRRSPKIELFHELKLHKSSVTTPSMSTPTKEQSSQMEDPGSLNLSKLLDELKAPSHENNIQSKTSPSNTSTSGLFVKKLLQFGGSNRPAYYGTWRKRSSTISGRHPLNRDSDLNYEVDSDEEWEEEDPGESLSDFDDEDEIMTQHDSEIDVEEEADNSFVVPDDYLSEDEGVHYQSLSGSFDESSFLLSIPGITVKELNFLLQRQKALGSFTDHALTKDRPLLISNLDHRKLDLLQTQDINGILKVEQLCLQALCMRKYPGGPIVDVPADGNVSIEGQELHQSKNKSPRTPVASRSISDSDIPEFVKVIESCSQGISKLAELLQGRFPCVSKAALKNKVREIAVFTNNRWQVKEDILAQCGSSLCPDKGGSPKGSASHFSQ